MNDVNVIWPGWETGKLIGRGSFGSVYEIQRDVLGDVEKAALKVISIPQNGSDIDEMYSDGYDDESITSTFQSHLKSIVAEYSLMRKMNGSANIVNCDDIRYVQHDDGFGWDIFIKMELLTPLTKALPEAISEAMVVKIASDLCAALELCKKHGIIHRDIKPQNIFLSPNGDYKLGDFGIAKTVEKTMGGTKIGTYKYMAPEVYNNQPYGTAADIYSLGLVLYWLLNERRMPFLPLPPAKLSAAMDEEARNRRFAGEPLPPPAHGSEKLKQIVLKACSYRVEDRYTSASEILMDLNRIGQDHSGKTERSAAPQVLSEVAVMSAVPAGEEDKTVGAFGKAPSDQTAIAGAATEEELAHLQREWAERERVRRAQEEQARLQREWAERERVRRAQEEQARLQREWAERERWRLEQEAMERRRQEQAAMEAQRRQWEGQQQPKKTGTKTGWIIPVAICAVVIALLAGVFGIKALLDGRTDQRDDRDEKNENSQHADVQEGDANDQLAGTYNVTLWVSGIDGLTELTQMQIDAFEAANPGIIINASIEGVSEADAGTMIVADVASAPDIYCFAQDQLARLAQADALMPLGADAAASVRKNNDAVAVAAGTLGGTLYAYPMTSDNGYYMYYDRSIISDEDAESMEAIIAACERSGVKFRFALDNAWYISSFFFATGCHSNWVMNDDGEFIAVDDTFNSPEGIIAIKGMRKLTQSPCYDSNADIFTDAGVVITGIWMANVAAERFGDNLGVTDLPSFEVDGKSYHLGSYTGNKLMGVKPQSDAKKAAVLSLLAQYLTNEACQLERYNRFQWGPSNKNAQASGAVQANPHLAALLKQNANGQPQGQIHGKWWDIAKELGINAVAGMDPQAALNQYTKEINGLFQMTEDQKNAWSVIGSICGTNWSTDIPMYKIDSNTWISDVLALNAGEEFKVRKGGSWDVNIGSDGANGANCVVGTSGKYQIQLILNGPENGTVTLIPVG